MQTFSDWIQFAVSAGVVLLFLLMVCLLLVLILKNKKSSKSHLPHFKITELSQKLNHVEQSFMEYIPLKKKKKEKKENKLFVISCKGDTKASFKDDFRDLMTTILHLAQPQDELVVQLESGGGLVQSYGFASSQLERIRQKNISLTVCIDEVAASGGYLMATVAHRIVAAPFAIVGSIGVVSQMPNIHKLLQKCHIDWIQQTAGKYKRTLTPFTPIEQEQVEKHKQMLEDIHKAFIQHVLQYRPQLDIDKIATGEFWLGKEAQELKLVDDVMTSDEYILSKKDSHQILFISLEEKKDLLSKITHKVSLFMENKGYFKNIAYKDPL